MISFRFFRREVKFVQGKTIELLLQHYYHFGAKNSAHYSKNISFIATSARSDNFYELENNTQKNQHSHLPHLIQLHYKDWCAITKLTIDNDNNNSAIATIFNVIRIYNASWSMNSAHTKPNQTTIRHLISSVVVVANLSCRVLSSIVDLHESHAIARRKWTFSFVIRHAIPYLFSKF